MCKICSDKLKDAFSFKCACLDNSDSASAKPNISNIKVERSDESICNESYGDENKCVLCAQLIVNPPISISGENDDNSARNMIRKYIPEMVSESQNINGLEIL